LFVGLVFIHRIIEYIPTVSGTQYGSYNLIPTVLPVMLVLLNLNSGVGRKVAMLLDKFESPPAPKQQQQQPSGPPLSILPQGMNTGNPMSQGMNSSPGINPSQGPQGEPDYSAMFEPMAANSGGVNFF
jgi:hypothetical protein